MNDERPIELQAIYTKKGVLVLTDQDGRTFHAVPDALMSRERDGVVQVGISMIAPHWPTDKPMVEVTFRVPLKVEERLPAWMQEIIAERAGWP